jgi:hypothetical protein
MVELQFVVLAVAGSSPVGRPPLSPLKRFSPAKVWADCGQLKRKRKAFADTSLRRQKQLLGSPFRPSKRANAQLANCASRLCEKTSMKSNDLEIPNLISAGDSSCQSYEE